MLAYGKEYGGTWKHPFIDAATAADLDRLAVDRFLIGTPDRIMRDLEPFVRQYGMTHVIFRLFTPGMPHATSCVSSSSWRGRFCPRSASSALSKRRPAAAFDALGVPRPVPRLRPGQDDVELADEALGTAGRS